MNETTDAAAIFAPLWRRKWLILIVGVLVAAGTYVYYRHQPAIYQAKTELYFGSSEQQAALNSTLGKTSLSPTQLGDQANLLNSTIGEGIRRQLREKHELAAARGKVRAKAVANSDFIEIIAEAHGPRVATLLANAYAQAYIKQHQTSYQHAVKAAIDTTRRQLHRIEASEQVASSAPKGQGSTANRSAGLASATLQTATLSARISQLESDLSVSGVQQVGVAKPSAAESIAPAPKKNAIFGFVIGLALAAALAYGVDRFERRLRSLADVERVFHTQVLVALPKAKASVVHQDGSPRPAERLLEPLRALHMSLQLGDMLEHHGRSSPRLILFLSADAGDGKSTLVANLALVQRDAGARVAVIEADLRRPAQAGLLSLGSRRGLAEVLTGAVTFEGAMQHVGALAPEVGFASEQPAAAVSTIAQARRTGSLSVLAGGGPVANPPALLASPAMQELLRATAAADYDYVLIDAPPLQVSDAMSLLRMVDGIVIVARLEHTREPSGQRLVQLLSRSSTAPVLGVVANAVSRGEIRKHGFFSSYGERPSPSASAS
ncbi:MAG TPA: Wzz/FepE/Etk N-terminal domain-containing protein [Solirubrobacteraceae bacterium]|jgi:Mrp family chromosome partitioning ATPase/capsular polysaccharide biosynthesis protein|nr:Wzz/FepE/Etk N-terminal domain-containing protein [Solirubrobacteraceae bacterium]